MTSLATPRMRRTLRSEKRGRRRNPFTRKFFHAGSCVFEKLSRFDIVIVDGSSSSRSVVFDRFVVCAKTEESFDGRMSKDSDADLEWVGFEEEPKARIPTQTATNTCICFLSETLTRFNILPNAPPNDVKRER